MFRFLIVIFRSMCEFNSSSSMLAFWNERNYYIFWIFLQVVLNILYGKKFNKNLYAIHYKTNANTSV